MNLVTVKRSVRRPSKAGWLRPVTMTAIMTAATILVLSCFLVVVHPAVAAQSTSSPNRYIPLSRTGPLTNGHTLLPAVLSKQQQLQRRSENSTSADQASSSSTAPHSSRSFSSSSSSSSISSSRRSGSSHISHNLSSSRSNGGVTGRLFFFKGLKKFMWPVFIGLQMVKTVLLALFLPSIIGSLGKIVGKGLSTVSSFGQPPVEVPEDLDFKDNSYNSDMMDSLDQVQTNYDHFSYPQDTQEMTGNQMFDNLKKDQRKNTISRYGPSGQKMTYTRQEDPLIASGTNDFKQFHEMPASSTLLNNYDPFYSPLLSRLDAVFQQLSLPDSDEACRAKLICLMYANPAKYAPYSNLVSAQLSRELNQLRKPISDNPEILRFFKYMRAAREGQESSASCDGSGYDKCPNLTDNTNPAMIKTFNDINKLVQARRF